MCYVYLRDSKSTQLIVSRQTKPEDVTPAFSFYSLFIPCLSLNDRNYALFLQNFILINTLFIVDFQGVFAWKPVSILTD